MSQRKDNLILLSKMICLNRVCDVIVYLGVL
jgi:hypothetical protein